MKMAGIGIAAAILAGPMLLSSCSSSGSSSSSSSSNPSSSTASSSSGRSTGNSPLSVDKVQRAVDRALDWTRKGGGATVLGIQELPQENAAKADIRFDGFQYNANGAGTPMSKDKKGPAEPAMNDPDYYRKMAEYGLGQMQVKRYSGKGVGILKHYNDGRWVLTEVHFDFEGVKADIEIQ